MAQLSSLTKLYQKISDNLSDEDVKSLRTLLVPDVFGVAKVQHASALEIFKMLQADNKIGKGDLGLLVDILKSLGKGRLAEEAEQLEQQQRTEAQEPPSLQVEAAAAMPQTAPMMSEASCTLLQRNYPTIYQELDATRVLDYLHEQGVITEEMREEILAIPGRHHRTKRLLDLIQQMDDRAFITFRTALGHAGYRHLVELLTGGQPQLMPRKGVRSTPVSGRRRESLVARSWSGLQGNDIWPKFEHFWGSCTSGDLSTTLSELLLTEEMRGLEGGDQLVVRTLVLEQDVTAWRDFFMREALSLEPIHVVKEGEEEKAKESQQMEERPRQLTTQGARTRAVAGHVSFQHSTLSQGSSGSILKSAGFPINVEGPAVESLPCSVTVTANTVGLIGGDVAPQIKVTSPQGKTTLIRATAHTSPPLAAGKGQTSRVRRVWGGVWRPQESGKHTLGVCMGVRKDLGSLTVDVGSNNPVLRFGQKGSQQGQFNTPIDVAVRGDRLYVADTYNRRVQVFDLSGKFCHSLPTTENPVSLAVQTDGTIVVNSGKEVKKLSPSLELLHKFPLGEYCTEPYGLAVQRDGRVVVADKDKHSIFLFEADGTLVKQVGGWGQGEGQFNRPYFVCVDKEDNIIVADKDNHRVQVFDKNLNFKHKFGRWGRQPQNMWYPFGVSADSRGNIVLANSGGEKLQVFRPDGTWNSTISSDGDKLHLPCGVAVTEDGHLFVADPGDDCIKKYRYM
ncbi:TRIM3 [Branchiostoma lanceolatum]|uniref:TRIM3 protein n=1 Tax=Branchiostoma lanceolatum TaxID=7740 RepID=A0A8J9YZ77_BRALA|nr:TRIM3 [Branchiostoma lanceolatum]